MNNEPLLTNEQHVDESLNQPIHDEQRGHVSQSNIDRQGQSENKKIAAAAIAPCWTGARRLAALSIDTIDRLGHHTLSLHEQLSHWGKDTAWAPLLRSQQDYLQHRLTDSVRFARVLWQVEAEKTATGETGCEARKER